MSELDDLKKEVLGYLDANELYNEVPIQYGNCVGGGMIGGATLLRDSLAKMTQRLNALSHRSWAEFRFQCHIVR